MEMQILKDPVKHEKGLHRVFTTDVFGFAGEKNNIALGFGGVEKGVGLSETKLCDFLDYKQEDETKIRIMRLARYGGHFPHRYSIADDGLCSGRVHN